LAVALETFLLDVFEDIDVETSGQARDSSTRRLGPFFERRYVASFLNLRLSAEGKPRVEPADKDFPVTDPIIKAGSQWSFHLDLCGSEPGLSCPV